ncbi:DUF3106 domain-containing protein [Paraburkholderia dinghuensis]|uniref:DUF3106 domain-containing protein n=1 Tax=Paraburkholderia dinghuensis TaxID=2305225 RepID=A0A3N6Q0V4_9BURK|nr:DUF3106 domain-containing protein [Paraburkholderia dinghuensis]RQH08580.1 DUF3106 domain-containing protein [Paraburkholderia dinghuensis]
MSYKRGLAVVTGSVIAALVSYAATYPRFHPGHAAATAPDTAASGPSVETSITTAFTPLPGSDSPLAWARLSDAQHTALAPFALEWDKFSDERRRKWLKIAANYPKMSPEAQKRLHERMTEWVRMTPDQRRVARENYQVSKTLPPQARQRAWTDYQQLPPDQKARLAATEHKRRTVISAPPTGGKREIRDIERLVDERERRRQQHAPTSLPASGPVATPGTSGAKNAPVTASAAVPAPASFVPATPIPAPPADTPALYKGS